MPFTASQLKETFATSHLHGRLGQTYLLTGRRPEDLEALGMELAEVVLDADADASQHPDFHVLRPASKSRRISVAQIRELERSLYLKAFEAPMKVALVTNADRMCLGQAEAANAFLKTLEEPPKATLLLLATTRPAQLLPTIISRCLRLDLLETTTQRLDPPAVKDLIGGWFELRHPGGLRAYARAGLLQAAWNQTRSDIEASQKEDAPDDADDDAMKAIVEGEFQLARQESIASLQVQYWRRSRDRMRPGSDQLTDTVRAVRALEQLQASLQLNVEPNLAVERACLEIEGVI